MYGLTLSHDYQDIIKDCWNIYHDWLTVLLDEPKKFLPQAIKDEPILYSKRMIWHLYNLFVPRKEPNGRNLIFACLNLDFSLIYNLCILKYQLNM